MKRKKVLLGLLMGLSVLVSGVANAQVNTGSKLVEVGPDNLGGRVTSLIIDQSDASHQTIFAGSATGGLFVKSNDASRVAYTNMWNYVPCVIDGQEIALSISAMVQGPDNTIYIATGEERLLSGNKFTAMTTLGQGIFKYNVATNEFSRIAGTQPENENSPWASISKLDYIYKDNVLYFFAATHKGLYKWTITSDADWANPVVYEQDHAILDIATIPYDNMLYFSGYNCLYKIGSVATGHQPINITSAIPAATNAYGIHLAVAPSNPNFVYALIVKNNGSMEGVYLTQDQFSWTKLNTSTINPLNFGTGFRGGAICVDPNAPNHIFVGGSSIWSGQGYVEGAYYQWMQHSMSEYEMYSGNYMADIYSSASFVHSGINQIVSTFQESLGYNVYYIATDGGVFVTTDEFGSFDNINQGLNNIQVNGVAVCTDGSLLAGATNNANIFIQSRNAHDSYISADSSVRGTESWYDHHPEVNANHIGNVIFAGNGGQVAASMFQQYSPLSRRTIFTSSDSRLYGRSYADYADYTNTQTWTTDSNFVAKQIANAPEVPQMYLWETNNVQTSSDSLIVRIDTAAFVTRSLGDHDTLIRMAPGTTILAGDKVSLISKAHADYPFIYEFENDMLLTAEDTLVVKNPLRSHLFVVSSTPNGDAYDVSMTWMPTDFRKVWYSGTSKNDDEMAWAKVYTQKVFDTANYVIAPIAVSNDGDCVYIGVNDNQAKRSFIVRVKGITRNVDYSRPTKTIQTALEHGVSSLTNPDTKLTCDTLRFNGSVWFPRRISSITFDPREGEDVVLITFQDRSDNFGNLFRITNATAPKPNYVVTNLTVNGGAPAYSSMIEFTRGEVYVGTEDGAWVTDNQSFMANPSWSRYGNFAGLPVTAMCQQIHQLPILRHTTHAGISSETNVYPRTKFPFAMYFGTYGRGLFMDSVYVVDHENEIVDSQAFVGIPRVNTVGSNLVRMYPNPATDHATLEVTMAKAGNVVLRVYDLSGRVVVNENLGKKAEGVFNYTFNCQQLPKGIYLVNVVSGASTATSKLVVK